MYINVLVERNVVKNDSIFTYEVPTNLEPKIKVGIRVIVPFINQKLEGLVMGFKEDSKIDYKVKPIIDVIDDKPILNEELLKLGQYMRNEYLAPLALTYKAMFPKGFKLSIKDNTKTQYEDYLVLKNEEQAKVLLTKKLGKKQLDLLNKLLLGKVKKSLFQKSTYQSLLEKGIIKIETQEKVRFKYESDELNEKKELTTDQLRVYKEVKLNEARTYLLHGVTGSGKTEIYMHLIEDTINQNKTALFLLPEIALTTQMINLFYRRFKEDIAVLHSRLSIGEKYDEYKRILEGKVKIVIGARSAIFAPLKNIGMIIIDEEHETSYKQESNPKYHALDIALERSKYHSCPLLLGSATPSLESYARASKGIYKLLTLKNRINNLPLPKTTIINMAAEYKKRNFVFSEELKTKIKSNLEKQEQTILLLNRRGYANYIMCPSCGYVHKCPNCDVSLTYHRKTNTLDCHYCGHSEPTLAACPSCGEKLLRNIGSGTEKIEEQLKKEFKARVLRIDQDTTRKKGALDKMLTSFRNNEYDIIIGTQMIAKGLDFPNVTLVGILNADYGLNFPDFRSAERTFQLLAQVAGRAGRKKEGEVIVQTFNTDHYAITSAKDHNYEKFYEQELKLRHKMKYTPFFYLTSINISGKDEQKALEEATKIKKNLIKNLSKEIIILGPTVSNVLKIKNQYRFQIILKYRDESLLKKNLEDLREQYLINKDVKVDIDINPIRL